MKHFLLSLVVCIAIGCAGSKQLTEPRKMKLSYGGGFSGFYTSYIIDEEGNVQKSHGIVSEYSPIGKLKKETTKQLFSYYDNSKLDNLELSSYSDMNHTISMMKDSTKHELRWEKNQEGTANIQKFYDIYVRIIEKELLPSKVEVHNE